mmetsp:Transcript_72337/g.120548  ORF Transcript_72337/g.120548 Transcript_72337/m.120548 type:complete len:368 (-) Transcript_72337:418-1521(-)
MQALHDELCNSSTLRCSETFGRQPVYAFPTAYNSTLHAFGRRPAVLSLDVHAMRSLTTCKKQPLLSAIITVHNSASSLRETLPLILRTVMSRSWELVCVLDACYDGTLNVIMQVLKNHLIDSRCCRVRVLNQPTAVWETSADNLGLRLAAPRLAYVLIQPDMVFHEVGWDRRMLRSLAVHADLFAVSGRCAHALDQSDFIGRCGADFYSPIPLLPQTKPANDVVHVRATANRGPLMLRAQVAQQLGFLDEAHHVIDWDEHDLNRRAGLAGFLAGYMAINVSSPPHLSPKRNPKLRGSTPPDVLKKEKAYFKERRRQEVGRQYERAANEYTRFGRIPAARRVTQTRRVPAGHFGPVPRMAIPVVDPPD